MRFERFIGWISILIIVVSCIFKIFFISHLPMGFDQAGISYIAEKMTQGKSLYLDYFDHKPPFMHYLLSFIFYFINPTTISINIIAFVFDLALLISIFYVSKKFIGKNYALLAAAIYSVFNLSLSLNTEIVMTVFGLWAFYFYAIWNQNRQKSSLLIITGALLAVSLWFKQSALIFFIALVLHIVYLAYKNEINKKGAIKYTLFLTLGVLIVSLPLLIFFLYKVGSYFLYALITFNLRFSTHSSRILQLGKGILIVLSTLGFALAAIIPSIKYIKENNSKLLSILLFITISCLLFILIQKEIFYQHFFQIMPFIAILAALSLKTARDDSRSFVLAILLIGLCTVSLISIESNMRTIQSGELQKTKEIGDYLHSIVKPNDSIFSDNAVYALLGNYDIGQPLVEIAPSFASVFDYEFICDQDYLVLTHRQTFLSHKVQDCINQKYILQKRFDNVGESFVEVLKSKS